MRIYYNFSIPPKDEVVNSEEGGYEGSGRSLVRSLKVSII